MIFDKDLSIHAKLVFLFLTSYSKKHNNDMPSNATIQKACSISKKTVINALSELYDNNIISKTTHTPEEIKDIVLTSKHIGAPCSWCGVNSTLLQEHHYPIAKSKGGTETILICPNCHYQYHHIENRFSILSEGDF